MGAEGMMEGFGFEGDELFVGSYFGERFEMAL